MGPSDRKWEKEPEMSKPIVVTGATGTVGSKVVEQLVEAGATVRAAVRDPHEYVPRGDVEAVAFDMAADETVGPALEGADHLFLLTAFVPEMVEMTKRTIDAAKKAGIEHAVRLSVLGAGPQASIALAKWHTEAERYLEQSGLGFTHLRPNSFMQNYITFCAQTIRSDNTIYLPHGRGRMSVIDVEDIAAVAVKVLLEPGHMGKAYDLTGPSAMDNVEIAAVLGDALGRQIHYMDIPDVMVESGLKSMGTPEVVIAALNELNAANRESRLAGVSEDVAAILGRPPRSFEAFVRANVGAWASS
jgi:uncharacterized protein YbjT (DUF2867 family)